MKTKISPLKTGRSLLALALALVSFTMSASCQTNYSSPCIFTTLAGKTLPKDAGDKAIEKPAREFHPKGLVVDAAGNTYFSDTHNQIICKIALSGTVTVVAGSTGNIGSADGTGSAARFYDPQGIATRKSST